MYILTEASGGNMIPPLCSNDYCVLSPSQVFMVPFMIELP